MPLLAGDKLGPYEILALIGKGGMGEVYRARDARLGRDVAIKVSAQQFTERFEREARAIAALNHPNICTLYDVGPSYLVMEFVEGESPKGPMPLDEALRIARQVMEALDAAHEKDIVHRDLKPANIKITPAGTVKVLDFGLAKMAGAPAAQSENSPTISMGMTADGMILGTAAYMSPEQARGKTVDKRADIWAFGVVLHELITGRRMFEGEDLGETLAAVIKEEPKWDGVPAKVRPLLERCLKKDPKKRLRDIGDAMLLLEEPAAAPPAATRRSWLAWSVAACCFLIAAITLPFAVVHFRENPPVAEPIRFQIGPPEKTSFDIYLAPSPDGRQVAFTIRGQDGRISLAVRDLNSLEARILPGTEDAEGPFWSPDSRFIAFGDGNKLKKVNVAGGPPVTLGESPAVVGSGAWSRDGVLLFGSREGSSLRRVPSAGGVPALVTVIDASRQEGLHTFPSFLPDGKRFIYLRTSGVPGNTGLYIGSLDAKPEQQSLKQLLAVRSRAVYAASPNGEMGHVLFLREGTLMAQPFDASRLELTGEPVPVAEQVGISNNILGHFGVSPSGVLAYRTDQGAGGGGSQLGWFGRQGNNLVPVGRAAQQTFAALSPDGTRAAVERIDPQNGSVNIWLVDLAQGAYTRFTFDPAQDTDPIWSPDGSRIVFRSNRGGPGDLYRKSANGAGNDELLLKSGEPKIPNDWSRDGRFLLFSSANPKTKSDLWVLPLQGDHKPVPYLNSEFNEAQGQFSPDTRWVAYRSDESGQSEIYVQPFPISSGGGGKWMVSRGAGTQPRWRRDGKELFYISEDRKVMAVDIATAPAFKAGPPRMLFEVPMRPNLNNTFDWDVTADGKKFLIETNGAETSSVPSAPITVVLNWQAGLRK